MKNRLFLFIVLAGILKLKTAEAQINAYAKVTAISGTHLTLSNMNQSYHTFAAGEQVLVVQMQDAVIGGNTTNAPAFGGIAGIASAGFFELATINTISGTTMTLNTGLSKTYNTGTAGSVQVVSFNLLSSGNYTLSSAVTGVAWDGNVGGIVAFQVGGTLTLSSGVTADGLGFRGGALSANYQVNCEDGVYDNTSSNYAFKGEGIDGGTSSISYTTHTGRGPLASGGGGGSDDNGGGGGGANYTAGGQGGQGWTCTSSNASGGLGGVGLGAYISGGRVFMGGGGGGGQQNDGVGTAGSRGGGIVFIRATTLTTSCGGTISISSNGLTAGNSGNDGAGGAGAGGSVVLSVDNWSVPPACPLQVSSNGGNGGNVTDPNSHGGGGGGGQGAVIYSSTLPTANITSTANNGTGGTNSSSGATSAAGGGGTSNTGVMSGVPIVLPVNILSFGAVRSGQQDIVSWSMARLDRATVFTVQRSADGVVFENIGVVTGLVDGKNTASYVFTDATPLPGKNYYRVSMDGGRYTPVDLVDWTTASAGFRIVPNPTAGNFTIQLMKSATETVFVSVQDLSGAIVYQQQAMATAGRVDVSVNKTLSPGIYLIRVVTRAGAETGKLLFRP